MDLGDYSAAIYPWLMAERKRGRPLSENPRGRRISVRLTEDETDQVEDAAARHELKVSEFARAAILWAAEHTKPKA